MKACRGERHAFIVSVRLEGSVLEAGVVGEKPLGYLHCVESRTFLDLVAYHPET